MSNNIRVLVACMPKSGSTYLSGAIEALPGVIRAHLVPGYGRREQELCIEKLTDCEAMISNHGFGYVAQHHVRYSEVSKLYFEQFGVRPVVLVRNIFDVVASLIDHHSLESSIYPAAYAPADIACRSFDAQARFITQMAIPWYFNFYASWQSCEDKIIVTYEDFIFTPELVLTKVCSYLGFNASNEMIVDAVLVAGAAGLRKNKIVSGRGKLLPLDCVSAIKKMASHYKDIDFSAIGIYPDDLIVGESL